MGLDDIESAVRSFEGTVNDFSKKLAGKQSQRLFTSHVWMKDILEKRTNQDLKTIKNELELLKKQDLDSGVENNVNMGIKHCQEVEKLMQRLIEIHKQQNEYSYVEAHWNQILPSVMDRLSHFKNRFSIVKGMLTKKVVDDGDWPF
ncbi:hypothetical protein HZB00_01955 [Candidatus Woesearchaeota archaeon]|nr:hypothetical protein [Candidatus Woesearchaeota archaeon]